MRFHFRKRTGQSGADLTQAVVFSCIFHVLIALAAVFLYIKAAPRIHVPPFYEVTLVSSPSELPQTPPPEAQPAPPKKEPPKKTRVPEKPKKSAPAKKAMPDFAEKKSKPIAEEPPAAKPEEQPKATSASPVTVSASQSDFKFGWYLALVREKIGQNWRPPPDAQDAKAKVLFSVNRSGWVESVNLDADHSTGTFGFKQAAVRAIQSSNPFPPLPEEFSKLSVDFSVDLMAE